MISNRSVLIGATVLGALLLTAARLPFESPEWLRWLHPDWALAVLMYWALVAPARRGTLWAWLMGILVDVLYSDLLGMHALTLASSVFVAARLQQRVVMWSLPQQAGLVALTAAVAGLVGALLRAAATGTDVSPFILVPPLTTAAAFAILVTIVPRQTTQFVP